MRIGAVKCFEKRIIGDPVDPYIIRRVLFRVPSFGIMLHKMCRSDHERALHDHPWSFISIVLRTGYQEVTAEGSRFNRVGAVLLRPAYWKHRVIIDRNRPAWTLVFVGRRIRKWGFWPNGRWCWWRQYNPDLGICEESVLWTDNDD